MKYIDYVVHKSIKQRPSALIKLLLIKIRFFIHFMFLVLLLLIVLFIVAPIVCVDSVFGPCFVI